MIHSLQLSSSQVASTYSKLKAKIELIHLKQAYASVCKNTLNMPIDELTEKIIDDHFEFLAGFINQPEQTNLLFHVLTYISEKRLLSLTDTQRLLDECINTSNARLGSLAINDDSIICVSWNLGSDEGHETIWLPKINYQLDEIVPESLIQLLNSSFLCLAEGFNLSALSLALLALETTIWDHLLMRGITRSRTYERYPNKVTGKLEWNGVHHKLDLFEHDGNLKNPNSPGIIDFEIYRSSKQHRDEDKCYLEIVIDRNHAEWLSDASQREEITKEHAGLGVALERARREELIHLWDKPLDNTFRMLRNALAHHPSNPENIRIQTPFGNVSLDKFSDEPNLVLFFIRRITEYISDAYFECRLTSL